MGARGSAGPNRASDSAVATQVGLTAVIGLLATGRCFLPASALRHADHGTGMVPGIHQGGRRTPVTSPWTARSAVLA